MATNHADYLYSAFTNATALSPTDTLTVRRWAELTMMVRANWLTGVLDTYVETTISAESTRDPTFAIMVIVSGHRGRGASLSGSRRRQTCACWR